MRTKWEYSHGKGRGTNNTLVLPFFYNLRTKWDKTERLKAIFNTYKEDIEEGTSITFVARGTSGAMIAGAMLNELHNINPTTKTYILIVRKKEDASAHCSSLGGIGNVGTTRFIVVDDFIASGETIEAIIQELDGYFTTAHHPNKYDMLCISNFIDAKALKKNSCDDYRKWKGICSRFKYVVCCPKQLEKDE